MDVAAAAAQLIAQDRGSTPSKELNTYLLFNIIFGKARRTEK